MSNSKAVEVVNVNDVMAAAATKVPAKKKAPAKKAPAKKKPAAAKKPAASLVSVKNEPAPKVARVSKKLLNIETTKTGFKFVGYNVAYEVKQTADGWTVKTDEKTATYTTEELSKRGIMWQKFLKEVA